MSIASLATVKSFLGIADTDEDAVLTLLLAAAEDQVVKFLGYDPNPTAYTVRRNGVLVVRR